MADLIFNVAKGRHVEWYHRVDSNDPANSALIVVPVDVGATSDATIIDFDTLAAVLGGGVTERNASGWNRKTLTDVDLAAIVPDDTNNWFQYAIPDQTWDPGPTAGNVTDLLLCYDNDTTAGTDANILPIAILDFVILADGSVVVADVGAAIARAS